MLLNIFAIKLPSFFLVNSKIDNGKHFYSRECFRFFRKTEYR